MKPSFSDEGFFIVKSKIFTFEVMTDVPPYLVFEVVSFLASIALYFQKATPRYMKLFPIFLFITLLVEITGWQLGRHGINNARVYNFYGILSFCFYLYMLQNFIHRSKVKRIVGYLLWIYPVITLINISFFQVKTFHSITYSFGCLLIVAICIYYFLELFQLPRYINLVREQAFWICSGLLFFYCCSFGLFSLNNLIAKASEAVWRNLGYVLQVNIFLFYLLLTIAFLCRIKVRRRLI